MQTSLRKIWRDVIAHRGRTLLVSFAIFAGVLGVITLQSGADVLQRTLNNDIRTDELAMMAIFVEGDDAQRVPPAEADTLIAAVAARDGVAVAEGYVRAGMLWKRPADATFVQGQIWGGALPFGEQRIEPFDLIAGDFPQQDANELMIEQRMAARYALSVGDTLEMHILENIEDNPLVPPPIETYTITGLVFDPYNYFGNDQTVYAHVPDVLRISGQTGLDRVLVRYDTFAAAETDRDAIAAALAPVSAYAVEDVVVNDPAANVVVQEANDWANTVVLLAILALLVSSFLVLTVISTIVTEQRAEIGVLKSLGATQFDNFSIYAGMALVYGVLGVIPAVAVGIFTANWLMVELSPLLGVYISGFNLSAYGIGVGIVLGLLVPVLASILPVLRGTSVTIIEAMTDLGIKSDFGHNPITRALAGLPLAFNVRHGFMSIYQKRGRLLLTGIMLTLAAGSFMGVTSMFMSIQAAVDDVYDTFNYDLGVYPQRAELEADDIAALLQSEFEEIETTYLGITARADIIRDQADPFDDNDNQYRLDFDAIDPRDDVIRFDLADGRLWRDPLTDNGVIISEQVADNLGFGVGDDIVILLDDAPFTVQIIGVDNYPFNRMWLNVNTLDTDTRRTLDADAIWVRFRDTELSANELDQLAGEMRDVLLTRGVIPGFFNQVAARENDSDLISTAGLVFNIASAVMATIGGAGLLVMLSISVYERQREIGVMRSIGAGSSAIASQFLTEGLLMGAVAWLLGIPLAVLLHNLLKDALPVGGFAGGFQPLTLVFGLVGALVLASVASLGPALSAARKTVADVLRYA